MHHQHHLLVAPKVKEALRRVTAKKPEGEVRAEDEIERERSRMWRLNEMSSFPSGMIKCKFCGNDSDSDCDDLGDADLLAREQNSTVPKPSAQFLRSSEKVTSTFGDGSPAAGKGTAVSPGPGIRWPWMKPWKGPLPKKKPIPLTDSKWPGSSSPPAAQGKDGGDAANS